MPVSTKSITDYIDSCLATSPTDQELAQMAGAITSIEAGDTFSVACTALLPTASENTGRWVYVTNIGAYRYSDGFEWTNCYDTTCRNERTELYAWGDGGGGNLMDGSVENRSSPTLEISASKNWCYATRGRDGSHGIKSDGTLWGWGGSSILGYQFFPFPYSSQSSSPIQECASGVDWCYVSSGYMHSHAIKTDGTLWGWGRNCGINNAISGSPLGIGCNGGIFYPKQEVTSSTNWCYVTAHLAQSLAIKKDGTLWGWGCGALGALGNNSTANQTSPVQEITSSTNWSTVCFPSGFSFTAVALKTDGTLWGWGATGSCFGYSTNFNSSPVQEYLSNTDWCALSVSIGTYLIKNNGTLWAIGTGTEPTFGSKTSSPTQEITSSTNWSSVSNRSFNGVGLKTDGTVWGWGSNTSGTLGDGTVSYRSSPVQEVTSSTDWCFLNLPNISGPSTYGIKLVVKGFNEP